MSVEQADIELAPSLSPEIHVVPDVLPCSVLDVDVFRLDFGPFHARMGHEPFTGPEQAPAHHRADEEHGPQQPVQTEPRCLHGGQLAQPGQLTEGIQTGEQQADGNREYEDIRRVVNVVERDVYRGHLAVQESVQLLDEIDHEEDADEGDQADGDGGDVQAEHVPGDQGHETAFLRFYRCDSKRIQAWPRLTKLSVTRGPCR